MSAENPTPVERLDKAKLIDSQELDDAQLKAVNSLSDPEVEALLSVKQKLGYKGTLNRRVGAEPDDAGGDFF